MAPPPDIQKRKADHLVLAASGAADFRQKETLLADVHLIHQALPERAVDDVDLSTEVFGKRLSAPLVITGMTGGTDEARAINRDLARLADELGIAFGVGSQRAMAEHPELTSTYQVRDVAPNVVLIGNLGAVQARALGAARAAELAKTIGADALAVHLNPAQELMQPGGDRDFRGLQETLQNLRGALPMPLLVKETGCGLSAQAAALLAEAGVRTVDVSGAGGTSWVAVETQRQSAHSPERAVGEELWDWGIPTAVSVVACRRSGLQVIASGGLRSGYDVARALALGASAGGFAAPVLRAYQSGGVAGARALLEQTLLSLRTVAFLSGCGRAIDLANAPRHTGPTLSGWLHDLGLR